MLVLDENLPAGQRRLLRNWRMPCRTVGDEVAVAGTADANLLPVLRGLPRPTFFTLDRDFHRADWAHRAYCLAWLDVPHPHAADFIRRFLRHPAFGTQARRMGAVVRIHPGGVHFWRVGQRQPQAVRWRDE